MHMTDAGYGSRLFIASRLVRALIGIVFLFFKYMIMSNTYFSLRFVCLLLDYGNFPAFTGGGTPQVLLRALFQVRAGT